MRPPAASPRLLMALQLHLWIPLQGAVVVETSAGAASFSCPRRRLFKLHAFLIDGSLHGNEQSGMGWSVFSTYLLPDDFLCHGLPIPLTTMRASVELAGFQRRSRHVPELSRRCGAMFSRISQSFIKRFTL